MPNKVSEKNYMSDKSVRLSCRPSCYACGNATGIRNFTWLTRASVRAIPAVVSVFPPSSTETTRIPALPFTPPPVVPLSSVVDDAVTATSNSIISAVRLSRAKNIPSLFTTSALGLVVNPTAGRATRTVSSAIRGLIKAPFLPASSPRPHPQFAPAFL